MLAWLGAASGYHLVDAPHFLGGGGPAPLPWIICFPPAVPELHHFGIAVVFMGLPALLLLAGLALWGRRQGRGGACRAGRDGPGGHRDVWLAG